MQRIIRNRRLTPEEAAKYNEIRREIDEEKPEINSRIRKRMTERKQGRLGQ